MSKKVSLKSTKTLQNRTVASQALFIEEYAKSRNISKACEAAHVARKTYYEWLEKYPEFKERCDYVIEKFDDMVEEGLFDYAKRKNKDILKFLAKHRLHKRGYAEKQQIEQSGSIKQDVSITLNLPADFDESPQETKVEEN